MRKQFTYILTFILMFTMSAFAESPKSEMLRLFGAKIKSTYENPDTTLAATGFCQVLSSELDPMLPAKTHLDYDLSEDDRFAWGKMYDLLEHMAEKYAKTSQEKIAVYRIFLESCKEHIGYYAKQGFQSLWIDLRKQKELRKKLSEEIRKGYEQ